VYGYIRLAGSCCAGVVPCACCLGLGVGGGNPSLMAIETRKNPTKKKLIKHARDRKNGDTSRRRLGTVSPGRGVSCACLFPVAFLHPLRGERKKGKKARAAFLTHAVDKCVREMAMQWPECSTRQTADSLVGRQCSPSQGRPTLW
jgi:hypothetical protein